MKPIPTIGFIALAVGGVGLILTEAKLKTPVFNLPSPPPITTPAPTPTTYNALNELEFRQALVDECKKYAVPIYDEHKHDGYKIGFLDTNVVWHTDDNSYTTDCYWIKGKEYFPVVEKGTSSSPLKIVIWWKGN